MPTSQQPSPHQPIAMPTRVALPPQRYSTFFALGSAVVMPFWTANQLGERVTAGEMIRAWIVHILAMVMLVLVVLLMDGIYTFLAWSSKDTLLLQVLVDLLDALSRRNPDTLFAMVMSFLFFLFTFVSNEIGLVVTPLFMLAWTARAESFSMAYLRTLKRIWLLTPVFVLPTLLVYAMALLYWQVLPESNEDWFGIDAWVPMALLTAMTLGTLAIVIYFWALQVGHRGESCRWPALCEACGYRLAGQERSRGSSCPECGMDVESSLTARVYRYETLGMGLWISPIRMGRSLLVHRNDEKPKLVFVVAMLLTVVVHVLAIFGTMLLVNDFRIEEVSGEVLMIFAMMIYMALSTMALVAGLVLFGTTIIGWLNHSTDHIAAHPAACAAMGYLSMYWPLIAVVQWLFVWLGVGLGQFPWVMDQLNRYDAEWLVFVLAMWVYLGIPAVAIVLHLAMTWLATRQARYANS